MSEKWCGITVSGDNVIMVCLEFDVHGNATVIEDTTLRLQDGSRPEAYRTMYERAHQHLEENKIEFVAIKGSAVSQRGRATLAHFESAELRGVVMAAASQSPADVISIKKAVISRTFGDRKADEYVADDDFWEDAINDTIRKGSRESALLILAARGAQQ